MVGNDLGPEECFLGDDRQGVAAVGFGPGAAIEFLGSTAQYFSGEGFGGFGINPIAATFFLDRLHIAFANHRPIDPLAFNQRLGGVEQTQLLARRGFLLRIVREPLQKTHCAEPPGVLGG